MACRPRPRVTALFAMLLVAHAAHVGEEVWGGFWLVDAFGTPAFLTLNALGLCAAGALFWAVRRGSRTAYAIDLAYAALMALQGVGHNVATLVTGRYFGGFAGGFTGLALLALGIPLFRALRAGMPPRAA